MNVRDVMTTDVELLDPDTPLRDAARRMVALDCGFLPVRDGDGEKLLGVVTDRDLALRGLGEARDPDHTPVSETLSERVLYCFADDDVEAAARSMRTQQVWRLIVLDDADSKQLAGVVSLGDIARGDRGDLVADTARGIEKAA